MSLYNSAVFSGVTFLFSLCLPFIVGKIGGKFLWIAVQILACFCYGMFVFVTSVVPAFLINAGIALNFCVFNSVPFALIPVFAGNSDHGGLYVGIFNSFANMALLLVNLPVAGVLILADQNAKWGIFSGCLFSALAVLSLVFLPNRLHSPDLSNEIASDIET